MSKLSKYATPQTQNTPANRVGSTQTSAMPASKSLTAIPQSVTSTKPKRIMKPRASATLEDTPRVESVHIAQWTLESGSTQESRASSLCGKGNFGGNDPEEVALVPYYKWCVACIRVWTKQHGRKPTLAELSDEQKEKYAQWLMKWRTDRMAKAAILAQKKSLDRKITEAPMS